MDVVSKLFNIKDSKNCIFGGTLIDIDTNNGYNKDEMLTPSTKAVNTSYPNIAVSLYSDIKEMQDETAPKSFQASLMSTWINGFIPNNKGLPSATGLCEISKEYTFKYSILKFDQVYPNREEGVLEALFSFFSFYGKNESILDVENTEDFKEKLINKGIVCRNWSKNPIQIRYVIRREGEEEAPDYIYLLGGSPILLKDNPEEIIPELQSLYQKHILDREYVFNKHRKICRVWDEITPEMLDAIPTEDKDHVVPAMQFLRMLSGIIYIRNYLYYAYHILGIESIIEFNGDSIKKIPTKKVLFLYEEPFQYCKTITRLMYTSKNDLDANL